MKLVRNLGLTIVIAVAAAGCGNHPAAVPNGEEVPAGFRAVLDLQGNRVVIPETPSRVALFGGPSGQIAYILGAQDTLCAVTNTLRTSRLVLELHPGIRSVPGPRTTSGSVNVEELMAADPELVIAGDIDADIVSRHTRIPVLRIADGMDEGIHAIIKEVRFYGMVFNRPERAERYVRYLQRTVALIEERTAGIPEEERPVVFNGYESSHLVTLGGDTFLDERVRMAGCRNAATSVRTLGKREGLHSGLAEVSMEQVLAWNPDILVVNSGSPLELERDPAWRAVEAVRQNRLYVQPAGIFIWNRPTAESAVLHPLWLATLAHPDRFRDVDIRAEISRFYHEVCEFDLTEAQVEGILSGDYEARIMQGARRARPAQ